MDDLVTRLEKAGAHASHTHELRGLLTDCTLAAAEIARLQADNRRWSKVADERSKENCALRQLLRDARDHVPWDVLKRIDAALAAEQTLREEGK